MTCDTTKIEAFHDGQLDAAERQVVEAHVEQCDQCRSLLQELRGLSQLISTASFSLFTPSDESIQHFHNAWHAAGDRSILKISSWMTAAAAAVLFGALLFWPALNEPSVMAKSNDWETAAMLPPSEPLADAELDFTQVAQWMAADLSASEGQ
jgi:anti-sigma factor RsiW